MNLKVFSPKLSVADFSENMFSFSKWVSKWAFIFKMWFFFEMCFHFQKVLWVLFFVFPKKHNCKQKHQASAYYARRNVQTNPRTYLRQIYWMSRPMLTASIRIQGWEYSWINAHAAPRVKHIMVTVVAVWSHCLGVNQGNLVKGIVKKTIGRGLDGCTLCLHMFSSQ